MRIVSIIADAVLAIKVPDEEMTSIKTTELALTLGRHTPAKLAGLTIEGGDGRFVLPVEKETLESSISGTSFVDTQVYFPVPSLFSQPNLVMLVKSLRTSGHIFVRHRIPPHPPLPLTSPTVIIGNFSPDVFEPRTATVTLIFPCLERFDVIAFVTSNHSHRQELFLSVIKSKTTPKKEIFDFRLPSVAHERLCLSFLLK